MAKGITRAAVAAAIAALALGLATPLLGQAAQPHVTRTLTHGGVERSYLLHVPRGHDATRSAALVLVFHGGGGNAESTARLTEFDRLADEAGFLVVYPNGSGRVPKVLTWNGGACCGYAQRTQADDVGFVRAIVADVGAVAAIDRKRIYATGLSNGAIMAYRLACEAADLIAAIAPVAGTQNVEQCAPPGPVALVHVHGTEDAHVPYSGGVGARSLTRVRYASVEDSVRFWVRQNRCVVEPVERRFADVRHVAYRGCANGADVELYSIEGGGHAWPGAAAAAWRGGDRPSASLAATRIIWEFFAAHPKRD